MKCIFTIAFVLIAGAASAEEVQDKPPDVSATINRGLAFLAKDALAWKKEFNCASCHHAGLVVWALREAKQRGHAVDEPVLAEMTKWIASSGSGKTGVPRPTGIPKALNTKPLYFGLGLGASSEPDAASKEALKLLVATLQEDQLDEGNWAAWPETRPPFFGKSDESMTALALLALLPQTAAGDEAARATREKGLAWLIKTKTDDDPQSVAMRLVLWQRLKRPAEECAPLVKRIKERQNAEGGWSQTTEMASDAWATGQALFALAESGLKTDDANLARGQAFLVKTQRDDGSWPMTSRPSKPDAEGAKNLIPITGGGSAWGVLGLVRSR